MPPRPSSPRTTYCFASVCPAESVPPFTGAIITVRFSSEEGGADGSLGIAAGSNAAAGVLLPDPVPSLPVRGLDGVRLASGRAPDADGERCGPVGVLGFTFADAVGRSTPGGGGVAIAVPTARGGGG